MARHPVTAQCIRCDTEYFNLGRIGTTCKIDECGGYITGRTREELKQQREKSKRIYDE